MAVGATHVRMMRALALEDSGLDEAGGVPIAVLTEGCELFTNYFELAAEYIRQDAEAARDFEQSVTATKVAEKFGLISIYSGDDVDWIAG